MSVLSSNVDTSEIAPSASLRQTMLMKCKMADSMLSRFIVQAIRNRICSTIKKSIRTIAVVLTGVDLKRKKLVDRSVAGLCNIPKWKNVQDVIMGGLLAIQPEV